MEGKRKESRLSSPHGLQRKSLQMGTLDGERERPEYQGADSTFGHPKGSLVSLRTDPLAMALTLPHSGYRFCSLYWKEQPLMAIS